MICQWPYYFRRKIHMKKNTRWNRSGRGNGEKAGIPEFKGAVGHSGLFWLDCYLLAGRPGGRCKIVALPAEYAFTPEITFPSAHPTVSLTATCTLSKARVAQPFGLVWPVCALEHLQMLRHMLMMLLGSGASVHDHAMILNTHTHIPWRLCYVIL